MKIPVAKRLITLLLTPLLFLGVPSRSGADGSVTRLTPPTGQGNEIKTPDEETVFYKLDSRFTWLCQGSPARSFLELDDGSLLNISNEDGGTVRISRDDGKSWSVLSKMVDGPGPGRPTIDRETGMAVKTRDDVIIWLYFDLESFKWEWDNETGKPAPDARRDVWAIRSLDGGKTWIDRQKIFDGYCGAMMDIIETSDGHVVAAVQRLLYNPGRHEQCTYVSSDNGKTWRRSNIIDLGGHGHHDGAFEGTMVELKDGRLYMLLRTNWDRFWEAYSWDGGISWRHIQPSTITTVSAPAYMTRLASGRLVMVWNNLPPGVTARPLIELRPETDKIRKGFWDWICETEKMPWWNGEIKTASGELGHPRPELSIAFSEDDGKTWSNPIVFAKGERVCYSQIWERRPGELWISFIAGIRRAEPYGWTRNLVSVKEKDLVLGE